MNNCGALIYCFQTEGPACFQCVKGKWGKACTKDCPAECSGYCQIYTGECLKGGDDTEMQFTSIQSTVGISVGVSLGICVVTLLTFRMIAKVLRLRRNVKCSNELKNKASKKENVYENRNGTFDGNCVDEQINQYEALENHRRDDSDYSNLRVA